MDQLLRPKAIPYKHPRNIPFFVSFLIVFSALFIRAPPIPVGSITVGLAEPFLALSLLIMLVDRWDYNRMFNTPITAWYAFFAVFGFVDLLWSIRFFHNKLGYSLASYRYIFLYPLAIFVGYNYFSNLKHLKNYHFLINIVCLCYLPLSVVFYIFKIGAQGSYLQYFDHTEAWVVSYLLFYAVSMYFMRRKTSMVTKLMAAITVIIIVLTNRRGIWVSSFASVFIVYYMSVTKISYAYISKIFLRVVIVVGLLFAITRIAPDNVIVKSVEDRVLVTINNIEDPTDFSEGQNSIAWRLIIYNTSINLFVQRPILGWGVGYVQTVVFPKGNDNFHQVDDLGYHDIFMTFLVTTGVVGLLLFMIFHGRFLVMMLTAKNKFDFESRPYVCAIFGFYTTGMIWSLVGNELISDPNVIVMWYVAMGILLRQWVLAKTRVTEE